MKYFWHVRPARTIALMLFSLLGLILCVGAIWAAAARLSQGSWPDPVAGWLLTVNRMHPGDHVSIWLGGSLGLLGLIALVCALAPGRFKTAPLQTNTPEDEHVIAVSSLADLAKAVAERTDGVSSARATSTSQRIDLLVRTPLRENEILRARITDRVQAAVDALPLSSAPSVRARMQHEGD